MKKILICLFLVCSILTGCSSEKDEEIKLEKYKYIYQTITDNDQFTNGSEEYNNNELKVTSEKYDITISMSKQASDYTYYINIDNPQIAMYEMTVMAIENNTEYEMADKIMPTIGILDGQVYNMVPFQSNVEKGYVKGLIISGTTTDKVVNFKIRISYKDYLLVNETQDYYSITVDYDSLFPVIEPETEVEESDDEQ